MTDRCHTCDRPLATDDEDPPGDPDVLCWSSWHGDVCQCPPVDWRARALAAEAEASTWFKAGCDAIDNTGSAKDARIAELEREATELQEQRDVYRDRAQQLAARVVELEAAVHAMHGMVDQTDPNCPIGVALTRAGLTLRL